MATITVPAAADIGAVADEVADNIASKTGEHDAQIAIAVRTLATQALADVTAIESDVTALQTNQTFALTLDGVGGTATKNTGITVTANTRAHVTLTTPGAGASGTRYAVSYVVGAPGVGAVTVTAKNSAAGDNTVTTDNSVLAVTLVEATPIA